VGGVSSVGAGRGRLGILIVLTLLAGALRIATLHLQSLEADEAVTVTLLHRHLGSMLSTIPRSESTPPLYYLLAWSWVRVFGSGEVGVRLFSALAGTLLVPAAYALCAELRLRRAALLVAVLVAINPFMFFYAQEARAYSLVALLCTLSLLFCMRALRGRPSGATLAAWSAVSVAALSTHYFAVFPLAIEAALLLGLWPRGGRPLAMLRGGRALSVAQGGRTLSVAQGGRAPSMPRDRRALAAVGVLVLAGLALAPLAIEQAGHDAYAPLLAASGSLAVRIIEIPKQLALGYKGPLEVPLSIAAAVLGTAGTLLGWRRSSEPERRAATIMLVVGAFAVLAPIVLALAGLDLVITRNLIVAWVPLTIVVAAGVTADGAPKRWRLLAVAICALSALVLVADLTDSNYQRDDWRGAARALGAATEPRAIVVSGPAERPPSREAGVPVALKVYLPGVRTMPRAGILVSELDLVALAIRPRLAAPRLPRYSGRPPPGVIGLGRRDGATFTVVRLKLPLPLLVKTTLAPGLGGEPGQVLVQVPSPRPR